MIKIKRNPKNQALIDKLVIDKEVDPITNEIFYQATINGNFVADVILSVGKNYIIDIYIEKGYRRSGIGTFLHDYIEKDLNIKLQPDRLQTSDGKAFWKNRLK